MDTVCLSEKLERLEKIIEGLSAAILDNGTPVRHLDSLSDAKAALGEYMLTI